MHRFNPTEVEKKWQKKWAASKLYEVDVKKTAPKDKYYNLAMFPYPSGDKLHVGHWYNFAPADSHGRFMRMHGKTVLEPMGFDSFGLPAENYAIKTGVHPQKSIAKNAEKMVDQLSRMGTMYDWSKTLKTSDPEYYKWTQWVFLQLYKAGLAYKKKQGVNFCPSCQTVLANEQVVEGACERCKHEVEKKDLEQWFFKISDYAEKLLKYDGVDWPENTKAMQENWIGKSKGSIVSWKVDGSKIVLDTYTTTVDTIYGVTFCVISPEHPLLDQLITDDNKKNVEEYMKKAAKRSEIDRVAENREKSGVFTGSYVLNPVNGEKVPLWVADYVLMSYGTGVVMGVPAHDQRDMDFAKKYKLDIVQSIVDADGKSFVYDDADKYGVKGKLVDSGSYTGMGIVESRKKITEDLKKKKLGKFLTNYKLRDWLISRQRYWGAPIPIINCPKCGEVPVPEKDLPVELPLDVKFELRGDGQSPLAHSRKFMNVLCPKCKSASKRESDTMDTFVCSSWYHLRYPSVGNAASKKAAFDPEVTKKWLPVDMYVGGPEHACMHLLYARFFTKVLKDLGHISFDEPFKKLVHQGMITKDGAKMSKSKGNVVSPDPFVEKYGSDVFRMYLMFMGPFTQGGAWDDKGINGIARFVEKFWNLIGAAAENADSAKVSDKENLLAGLHKTIKKVTTDIEKFQFNTAISALMEFVNMAQVTGIDKKSATTVIQLIAPMAPHLAEECWSKLGGKYPVVDSVWPKAQSKFFKLSTVTYAVQVNGKVRGTVDLAADISKDDALKAARADANVAKYLEGGKIIKEIFVPGKIMGFVVK